MNRALENLASSMNFDSSNQFYNPQRLKTLAFNVKYSEGNNILHQFVLDNSDPNISGSENYINAVLLSMPDTSSVNALNDKGYSALGLAVMKNNLLMVKKLLTCFVNIDVNRTDFVEGNSTLHLAVLSGHLSIIGELLNKGADINIRNANGKTPLCFSAESGDLDVTKFLVSNGANVNAATYDSPFHCEELSGYLPSPDFLVSRNTDVYLNNLDGWNVLCYAARSGNLATVEYLVCNGADLNALNGWTPLLRAAEEGYLDIIIFLLDRGVFVNNKIASILLHCATRSGDFETMMFLIGKGADVNTKDIRGETPLHKAARLTNFATVKFLVRNGADVSAKTIENDSPLHYAVNIRDLKISEFLIRNGADVNAENTSYTTPLCAAVSLKYLEIAEFLINQGADLHATDENGATPLHYASHLGSVEIVEFLVCNGADVNARDMGNRTPLHHAFMNDIFLRQRGRWLVRNDADIEEIDEDIIKIPLYISESLINFVDQGADSPALDMYDTTPHYYEENSTGLECAKLLINKGANLNATCENGKTALHEAVMDESISFTKMLIESGADVNARDSCEGLTPLHHILRGYHRHVYRKNMDRMKMKLLLEASADVDIEDYSGETALCCVMRSGNYDLIKLFSENATDLKNMKDKHGSTPLSYAVRSDLYDVVKLFLEKGADVNARNTDNTTPLFLAIKLGNSNMVKLFLESGADLTATYNTDGDTILHCACDDRGHLDIIEMLIRRGCDVNARNEVGETPLHAAVCSDNLDYVQLLLERGASMNPADIDGCTPLHFAVNFSSKSIIELLLNRGADVNAKKNNEKIPLDLAKKKKRPRLAIHTC